MTNIFKLLGELLSDVKYYTSWICKRLSPKVYVTNSSWEECKRHQKFWWQSNMIIKSLSPKVYVTNSSWEECKRHLKFLWQSTMIIKSLSPKVYVTNLSWEECKRHLKFWWQSKYDYQKFATLSLGDKLYHCRLVVLWN